MRAAYPTTRAAKPSPFGAQAKGGKGGPTVLLHHQCHKEIHACLSEAELARNYATIEKLKTHPRLEKFIAWVAKRPPEFLSRTPKRRR